MKMTKRLKRFWKRISESFLFHFHGEIIHSHLKVVKEIFQWIISIHLSTDKTKSARCVFFASNSLARVRLPVSLSSFLKWLINWKIGLQYYFVIIYRSFVVYWPLLLPPPPPREMFSVIYLVCAREMEAIMFCHFRIVLFAWLASNRVTIYIWCMVQLKSVFICQAALWHLKYWVCVRSNEEEEESNRTV